MKNSFKIALAVSILVSTPILGTTMANASAAGETAGADTPKVPSPTTDGAPVDQARIQLQTPLAATSALRLAELATPAEPIEIMFTSGEWTGGIVLSDHSIRTQTLVHNFLRTSKAATGARPIIALKGSEATVRTGRLAHFTGAKTYRSQAYSTPQPPAVDRPRAERSTNRALAVPCEDCDVTVNGASTDPGIPASGQLRQFRQQGFIERTHHELKGFSNKGYPATLHFVGMTNGHGGTIKPAYIYEHDYKITDNGYTSTNPSYDWTTNLPGAYRDTRARGLEGGDQDLDFTVGSVGTWLLDGSKTYTIDTDVLSGAPEKSAARLTASVIPNDGGRSLEEAALHRGCNFTVDPSTYPAPASITPTSWGTGDLAWCGGIGDFVNPSYVKNISLISLTKFFIQYNGTCRNWTAGSGFTFC